MTILDNSMSRIGVEFLKMNALFFTSDKERLYKKMQNNWRAFHRNLEGTRLFQDMKLECISSYEDYIAHVPVKDYEFYSPYVDMICAGHEDILFLGRPSYFGLSSGTSGQNSKKIPYNQELIDIFLRSQKNTVGRICMQEKNINLLQVDRLTFGSTPSVYQENGINFGYISGILSTKTPNFLKKRTFPSPEVLSVNDWDAKIELLIKEALHRDIQVISGIPTYIITILEAVLKYTGKKHVLEIWPNLSMFIYAATPIKQYADRINQLVGKEIVYYGLYASTEAPIGLPFESYKNTKQYYLLNPELLYSFTDVETQRVLGIHEIEMNHSYLINIGTPNGFVHYAMKDEISFKEIKGSLVFEFVGRKNTGMNLAAEKVSEDELLNAIIKVKEKTNVDIRHYFVSPGSNEGRPAYHWSLFTGKEITEEEKDQLAKELDQVLVGLNPDYEDCRTIDVIRSPLVTIFNVDNLKPYFEKNRARGQFKMKTTFKTEEEYFQFIQLNFAEV